MKFDSEKLSKMNKIDASEYIRYSKINYCKECNNTGKVNNNDCYCVVEEKIRKIYNSCGIYEEYHYLELEDFEKENNNDKNAYNTVKKYINSIDKAYENGIGLYLWGRLGAGKTMLSVCVLKESIRTKKYKPFFTTLSEIISYLDDRFSNKTRDFIEKIKEIDFLVIDDISREYTKDKSYIEFYLDYIIRYRNRRNKPTIITANCPIKDISSYALNIISLIKGKLIEKEVKRDIDYRTEKSFYLESLLESNNIKKLKPLF